MSLSDVRGQPQPAVIRKTGDHDGEVVCAPPAGFDGPRTCAKLRRDNIAAFEPIIVQFNAEERGGGMPGWRGERGYPLFSMSELRFEEVTLPGSGNGRKGGNNVLGGERGQVGS